MRRRLLPKWIYISLQDVNRFVYQLNARPTKKQRRSVVRVLLANQAIYSNHRDMPSITKYPQKP